MQEQEIILQGCKANSRISQQKLYMQAYDVMYQLCKRFFDDDQDIVTAINNGMLRVFKNIEQYNPVKSALQTWIYAIVRNEALTLLRNKKQLITTQELSAELPADIASNPFDKNAADEVLHGLGKLPQATRAVCTLYYLEGYSIKEIAAATDIKEGTIKWHLSDGRKKLQSLVKHKITA